LNVAQANGAGVFGGEKMQRSGHFPAQLPAGYAAVLESRGLLGGRGTFPGKRGPQPE
jgi:hypothetical protein